jgi:hypothetical protein
VEVVEGVEMWFCMTLVVKLTLSRVLTAGRMMSSDEIPEMEIEKCGKIYEGHWTSKVRCDTTPPNRATAGEIAIRNAKQRNANANVSAKTTRCSPLPTFEYEKTHSSNQ